jgi:hypothetical protein
MRADVCLPAEAQMATADVCLPAEAQMVFADTVASAEGRKCVPTCSSRRRQR